jgi:acyl carrier protein
MAVLELVYALEERFEIEVDGDDVTGDVFETLGSLATFVEAQFA